MMLPGVLDRAAQQIKIVCRLAELLVAAGTHVPAATCVSCPNSIWFDNEIAVLRVIAGWLSRLRGCDVDQWARGQRRACTTARG